MHWTHASTLDAHTGINAYKKVQITILKLTTIITKLITSYECSSIFITFNSPIHNNSPLSKILKGEISIIP
jgi:hypothetical protein